MTPAAGRKRQGAATAEPRAITLAGREIAYLLKRSPRRRTIGLRIDRHGLSVSAPPRAALHYIEDMLRQKADWVLEKLDTWTQNRPEPFAWTDGALLLYLGGDLPLRVTGGSRRATARLAGEALHVSVPEADDAAAVQRAVIRWYRREAQTLFAQRVAHIAARMGLKAARVALSSALTRWGSCNARGEIRLNWRLVQAPISQLDYVVVHELAHIAELNHSPRFWAVVKAAYPAFEEARRALRRDGERYHRV